MGKYLERLKRSGLGRFYAKYNADRADEGAILIAWQALLSLFPLILGLLAIFGLVLRDPALNETLAAQVRSQFPAQVSDLVAFMEETRDLGGILGLISILGLLWSGSALFGAMAHVFNGFYGAADRGFIGQRLMAFSMMAIYLVLMLVSVLASGLSTFLVGISERILPFQVPGFAFAIGWLISLGSALVMFLTLYRFVPNAGLSIGQVWRGAVLGAVLFVLLSQIFPLYLRFFGGGFAAYEALGLFLLLMTWFYFLARILVLGAELNAFLTGHGATSEEDVVRRHAAATGVRAARANGRERADSPGKVILWAGLTAGVTGLTLAAAQHTASVLWRALTGEDPPRKSE
jgi:membrane protein